MAFEPNVTDSDLILGCFADGSIAEGSSSKERLPAVDIMEWMCGGFEMQEKADEEVEGGRRMLGAKIYRLSSFTITSQWMNSVEGSSPEVLPHVI